jgi:nitrogenase molybdenum-iron protein NifN
MEKIIDNLPHIDGNKPFVATRNACKLCSPLGASLALKGIEGCVPIIHGSQGCSTYIRRYLISHFREPVDIASTNFTEDTTVFGGSMNLKIALDNVINQYRPQLVGIATTCLSETIGEDLGLMIKQIQNQVMMEHWPNLVSISTPSYRGSHIDGFHAAVKAIIQCLAEGSFSAESLNILPGMVSPADLRYIKEVMSLYQIDYTLLPDYSETLDNPTWDTYHRIPPGGTPVSRIKKMGKALATVEFTCIEPEKGISSPGQTLETKCYVKNHSVPMPVGVNLSDAFFNLLTEITGHPMPEDIAKERGRLIDSYVDGHKYVFGKTAVVYGEEDLVISLCSFLDEIGVKVILASSGGQSGLLSKKIKEHCPENGTDIQVMAGSDFEQISQFCHQHKPDLLIGNSKGYYISRKLEIPFIRVGFPIHDRIGGQRVLHIGYRGAQQLFDQIVNKLMEYKQEHSPVGYKYI